MDALYFKTTKSANRGSNSNSHASDFWWVTRVAVWARIAIWARIETVVVDILDQNSNTHWFIAGKNRIASNREEYDKHYNAHSNQQPTTNTTRLNKKTHINLKWKTREKERKNLIRNRIEEKGIHKTVVGRTLGLEITHHLVAVLDAHDLCNPETPKEKK